jgi:hypothetical protein
MASKESLTIRVSDVEMFVLSEKHQEAAEVFDLVENDIRHIMNEYVQYTSANKIKVEIWKCGRNL